ncbi:lecithin retinol acyltransferase family protein [Vaginisenegalia massiliensis]|uniref:lecithin retinol acyltransferase family protein n=1 Tax=Vaginisenegalia massiliensis TaxID=2058294 RepID=UPI000F5369A2|nr:lecithin retinol acyltransferase family protein [Vaginisenegalia massiliensis]
MLKQDLFKQAIHYVVHLNKLRHDTWDRLRKDHRFLSFSETFSQLNPFPYRSPYLKKANELLLELSDFTDPPPLKFADLDEDAQAKLNNLGVTLRNPFINGQDVRWPKPADHLFVSFGFFTHHGIYIGHNQVIHFSITPDSYKIIQSNLQEFSMGLPIKRLNNDQSPLTYSIKEAIQRAKSQLNETDYNLLYQNCEHFVIWCRQGDTDDFVPDDMLSSN